MPDLATIIRRRDITLKNAMHAELTKIMIEQKAQYTRVVMKWSNKPDFRVMMVRSPKFLIGRVVVRGKHMQIWQYVDKGTRAHFIRPRFAPYLMFRTGYSPRTQPIARFNVGTGKAFGRPVKTLLVLHPGNKARKFSETFAETVRLTLKRRIARAIQRA